MESRSTGMEMLLLVGLELLVSENLSFSLAFLLVDLLGRATGEPADMGVVM